MIDNADPAIRRGDCVDTLDVSAEWEAFKAKVIAAFAPVKEARAELQSPENIAKAAAFAEAVGRAWKEVA